MKYVLVLLVMGCLMSCSPEQKKAELELKVLEDQSIVEVWMDDELFTSYRFEKQFHKPVLYPISAPGGMLVTRGFPLEPRSSERVDHPHHVGLWLNFGDVNGFDFWNNSTAVPEVKKGAYGRILHRELLRAETIDGKGILEVGMDWLAPDTDQAEILLSEQTSYVFQAWGEFRVIDRFTRLTAVADQVVFTDNKEGMLAIRVDRAFELPSDGPVRLTDETGNPKEEAELNNEGVNGWYRNSGGIEGKEVWGKRALWVKLGAKKEGQNLSMVLMDHPDNEGFPACWHARTYGLFSINNLGSKVFNDEYDLQTLSLSKGEVLSFRHRFVLAARDLGDASIQEIYQAFIEE
jgi:hypothetical protein